MPTKITDTLKKLILADYHAGIKQAEIARKYKVSPSMVVKLHKHAQKRNVNNINDLVRIKQDFCEQPVEYVNAAVNIVDQKLRDLEYFREASLLISKAAIDKVKSDPDMFMSDIERAQNIIAKGKETVLGKAPETAVQVNNNGGITYKWEDANE